MGLLDDMRERQKFANLDPSDPSITASPQGTQLRLEGADPSALQAAQRGGLSDAYWNLAEFLENFLANFGFNPFIGTGIEPSELDIPNLSPADVDDIWESIDPGLKDFMTLFLKGIEGLDADDIDRINRQEQANEWLDAYTKYLKDEITLEDLQAVDVSDLSGMDGWDAYYSGIVGDTTDGDGTDGTGDGDEDQGFADYVNEVGEGVANTAKGLYDELGDKITECVGSPLECIKQIGTAILDAGGIPPECQDMNDPFFCTEKSPEEGGKVCWKDCVSFNLPGLPIPNIPLPPGVVDIGTYRDFEDAIKTVGKTIGDIIEGNESCGPDGKQECTVGQVLEDVGTWAKEKWEEVFSGVDDATVDDVLDWLKGILGPVTAGIIWAQIEEEVTNVLTPVAPVEDFDCSTVGREQVAGATKADDCGGCTQTADDGTPYEIEPTTGACKDPTTTEDPDLTAEEQECNDKGRIYQDGVCLEECQNPDYVVDPIDGECGPEDEVTECQDPHRDTNDDGSCADTCKDGTLAVDGVLCPDPNITTPEECGEDQVRRGGLDDGRCMDIGEACFSEPGKYGGDDPTIAQGQINSEGFCTRGGDTETPTDDELCSGPRPPQTQNDKNYCFQQGYAPCPEGTEEYQNGRWYKEGTCTPLPPTEPGTPCDSNGDGNLDGTTDANGNCNPSPPPPPTGCQDPFATNQGEDGPCECPPGFVVSPDGTKCLETGGCTPKGEVIDYGCDGTTFYIRMSSGEIDPNTGECGEIYDTVPNYSGCAGGGICNDPNAVNDGEEGTCECKPGFTKNAEGLCFQSGDVCDNGATVESGCDTCPDGTNVAEYADGKCPTSTPPQDCSDPAYAAANPEECFTSPPPPPPSSGGGGGGGVGGGVGAFSPFIAGIEYTPQPLPAAPAAPQKDYMAELDNLIKRRLFEGIA